MNSSKDKLNSKIIIYYRVGYSVYFCLDKLFLAILFYYSAYFCYYSQALLHFLVLFMDPAVLFQLTFTFIYSIFSKKISAVPKYFYIYVLKFITSSSTLLHLRFAFLLVRNFCVFYQYQCNSVCSQVEFQIYQYDFFFLVVKVPLFISFIFVFFFLLRFFDVQNANLFWF